MCWSLASTSRLIILIGYKSVFRTLSKGFGLNERQLSGGRVRLLIIGATCDPRVSTLVLGGV